jgi:glycosyltransferase involved in cell wall biosynthesis
MINQISVVMPAYNSARFVRQAIESILNQTYSNFEFIVVDDGSTDDTLSIALAYAERDRRVRVIQPNHGGSSTALNIAIEEATNDWVAIMHADDVSLPYRLERQLRAARNRAGVVAWGAFAYHINSIGKILSLSRAGPTTEEEFYDLRRRGQLFTIIHPTALLRKDIVQRAGGYDPRFGAAEDLDLFERMAEFGPILAVPEPLVLYRMHGSSVTMGHFSEEKFLTRFVSARLRARLRVEPLPTLDEFGEQYRRCALPTRLRRFLDDSGKLYYRRAGIAFANGQYLTAAAKGLLSGMLNPWYVFSRLWGQRLSPVARQWLSAKPLRVS